MKDGAEGVKDMNTPAAHTPDRIERSLALIHAIAAGIDAAYKDHSCGNYSLPVDEEDEEPICGICVLKRTVDDAWRAWLDAHPVDLLGNTPPEDLNALAARWLSHFQGTAIDGLTVGDLCGVDDMFLWWNATTGMTRTLRWPDVRAMLTGRD